MDRCGCLVCLRVHVADYAGLWFRVRAKWFAQLGVLIAGYVLVARRASLISAPLGSLLFGLIVGATLFFFALLHVRRVQAIRRAAAGGPGAQLVGWTLGGFEVARMLIPLGIGTGHRRLRTTVTAVVLEKSGLVVVIRGVQHQYVAAIVGFHVAVEDGG